MKVLLCIDDTDNLDSIGTGEMLQNIVKEMVDRGWCSEGFVTRHQLFIHEDIAYTSHNSSMCTDLETKREYLPDMIAFCGAYLEEHSAEGSDPGLCFTLYEELPSYDAIIAYGEEAKKRVVQKQEAYDFAAANEGVIFLSEHGGTGIGVIGALAGCGLRLCGSDGKIKGKIKPENPELVLPIKDFLAQWCIDGACDADLKEISEDDLMVCGEDVKAYMKSGRSIIVFIPDPEGKAKWRPMTRDEAKERGIGV